MSAVGPSVTDGATESLRVPTLTVSVTPVLSYALAYNRIAVVHRVDIANPGPATGCGDPSDPGRGCDRSDRWAAADFLVDLHRRVDGGRPAERLAGPGGDVPH